MSKLGLKGEILVAIGQRNEEGEIVPDFAEVGCYGKGFFAVHKTVGPEGETDEGWRITHTPTRFKIGPTFDTRAEAIKVRDALVENDEEWEFFSHDELDKDQQRKLIQQVADAVAGKEPEEEEEEEAEAEGMTHSDAQAVMDTEEMSTTPEEPAPDPEPEPDTVEVGDTDEIDTLMAEYGTDDGDDEDIADILASLEDYE